MQKLVAIAVCFLTLSCSKERIDPGMHETGDTTRRYLALGDSYTIGESVDATQTYPQQTVDYLNADSFHFEKPKIIAVTGWTTTNLLNALDASTPDNNFDIVTLLIGVNNQYQGRSLENYKSEFSELLRRSVAYAGGNKSHVIVLSIPDYSVTPFGQARDTAKIAAEIAGFNEANKDITRKEEIAYLDITQISKGAKTNAALTAADGLHPSAEQYKRWSTMLAPVIENILK